MRVGATIVGLNYLVYQIGGRGMCRVKDCLCSSSSSFLPTVTSKELDHIQFHQRFWEWRDEHKLNNNTHWHKDRHLCRSTVVSGRYISQTKSIGLSGQG